MQNLGGQTKSIMVFSEVTYWIWIIGEPLTFDKWQKAKPVEKSYYVLIAKEFPPSSFFGDGFVRNKQLSMI